MPTEKLNVPGADFARVTVRSIAEAAGVSIGSVSSVLNNRHVERRISPETVDRIRAAAASLGYLPNISARRLRSKSAPNTILLALITSYEAPLTLVNHFVSGLRHAADAGRRGKGADWNFSLLIEMYPVGRLSEMPGVLTGDHFNAALVMNTTPEDDRFLGRSHLSYPVVLVNREIPRYACVVEDPKTGARAARVLFQEGRRRLAVLHGSPLTQSTRNRVDGFMLEAARIAGQPPHEIEAGKLSEDAAYLAMRDFLKTSAGSIDGLYCVTDGMAVGAFHALKEHGKRIPRDVAVVGVGDYDFSRFFDPPLSTVGVSHSQLGIESSRLLLQLLHPGSVGSPRVEIPLEEHLRESSGHA